MTSPGEPEREWVGGYEAKPARERRGAGHAPGTLVGGRYRISSVLGHGALGVVFRARDTVAGSEVALKVLRGSLTPAGAERLRREAALMASLDHPGIVKVREAGETPEGPFLVSALVPEAVRLDAALPGLDRARRLEIVRAVVDAVAHAHERGVVHRDLKPENVLLDRAGRAFVIDFGVAWTKDADSLTETGALLGTPTCMAPEQLEGRSELVGPPTDVWALGVLLYGCLADRTPFVAQSLVELARLVTTTAAPRLRTIDPSIPASLEAISGRCLARDPSRRYPDARALLADLDAAREGRAPGANPRRRGPLLLGLAGALLAAAATWAVIRRDREAAPEKHPVAPVAPVAPMRSATAALPASPARLAAEAAARDFASSLDAFVHEPDLKTEAIDLPLDRSWDRLRKTLNPLSDADRALALEPVIRAVRGCASELRASANMDRPVALAIGVATLHLVEYVRELPRVPLLLDGALLALRSRSCPDECGAAAHEWMRSRVVAARSLEHVDPLLSLTLFHDGYDHFVMAPLCREEPRARVRETLARAAERVKAPRSDEAAWADRMEHDVLLYRSTLSIQLEDGPAAAELGRAATLLCLERNLGDETLGMALSVYSSALGRFGLPLDASVERALEGNPVYDVELLCLRHTLGRKIPLAELERARARVEGRPAQARCRQVLDEAIAKARQR